MFNFLTLLYLCRVVLWDLEFHNIACYVSVYKMYNLNEEIKSCRQEYANLPANDLILKMQRYGPSSAQHIAAKQLLREKDMNDLEVKHSELIDISKRASHWAMWAVIVSVIFGGISLIKECSGNHSRSASPVDAQIERANITEKK